MRVRLLGGLEVEGVAARDLGSRKARTLLKVLAVRHGAPVPIDTVVDVLWGDRPPAKPVDQVGVLVSRLRSVLGATAIERVDAGYVLHTAWLDIDEVEALTGAAADALADGRVGTARAATSAALDLARGPLLADEDSPWFEPARTRAAATVTRARRIALDAAAATGDDDGVVALAESLLASDPYDEVVLRALMRAHLTARRPASALAAYGRARQRLAEDLGVPLTAETEELHRVVLQAADGDRAAPGGPAGGDPPLFGRGGDLEALDRELRAVEASEARTVLIEGEAGIGKSMLIDTWVRALPSGTVVLRGRCDELGRDLPMQPLADALAVHLRQVGPDGTAEVLGPDAEVLGPLLGPVAGAPPPASGATATTSADAGRMRMYGALLAAMLRAAGRPPLVVVIEDIHAASSGTIAWIPFAERRGSRLLVVATSRPPAPRALEPSLRITLGPLTPDDVAVIAGSRRGPELHERTGGHPLLLNAFLAAEGVTAPSSLRDAVASQLASLDPGAAATVRCAAVVGGDCDADLIAVVRGLRTVDVLDHLDRARGTGLLVERHGGFAFRHELLRGAVVALSRPAELSLVHRDAAVALSRRPRPDPLAVAIHARAGNDDDLAAVSFVAAAEAAARRFDLDSALDHLAAAIEVAPDDPAAHIVLARIEMSRAGFDAAATAAGRAIELGGGATALEVAGWVAYYRRRYDSARAHAEEAIAAAPVDDPVRVSAAALAGRVSHGAGDLLTAVDHLTAAGDAPLAVRGIADVWLAQARLHQGRPEDALRALARPLVAPDSLAHPWAPLHLRFNHAMALGQLGRVQESLAAAADLVSVAGREGPIGARLVGPAHNVASWVLRWTGRFEEADEANEAALEAAGGDGPASGAFEEAFYVALLDLADGALLRGDLQAADPLLARLSVIDSWNGTMAWHQRHRLGLLRARMALASGDRDSAAAHATATADDAASRGAGRYELLGLALAALADEGVPASRLAAVVDGLARCASLDGWWLVWRLGQARRVDRWCGEAERRAASMVRAASDGGDRRATQAASSFADRMLTAPWR